MADTFTTLLRLIKQETGGNENVWGDFLNLQMIDLIDDAVAGFQDVDVSLSNQILLPLNGDDDPTRAAILVAIGLPPDGTRTIQVPSTSKLYVLSNDTSETVTFKTAAGSGLAVAAGDQVSSRVDPNLDDVVAVSVPSATEDIKGIAEIADQTEVDAGTDDERFVTPLKLASADPAVFPQATETARGVAEIADQAETDAGTDDERFITPLKFETSEQLEQSTTSSLGRVIQATQGEVDTGTDTDKYVTPATLASAPTGATVIFTGFVSSTGVGAQFPAGWSVLRNSIGIYTVTHSLGLSDVDDLIICVTAMGEPAVPAPASSNFIYGTVFNRATNSFQVLLGFPDMGTIGGAEHEDHDWNFIAVDNS